MTGQNVPGKSEFMLRARISAGGAKAREIEPVSTTIKTPAGIVPGGRVTRSFIECFDLN